MTDLTPVFQKYINIIKSEYPERVHKLPADAHSKQLKSKSALQLKDTFIKECYDLLNCLIELKKILSSIESQYKSDVDMTELEKDDFDTDFRLQFQKYIQKFQLLEKYENERQNLINERVINPHKSNLSLGNLFHIHGSSASDDASSIISFHVTNNKFRLGVLQSLNLLIGVVSSKFTAMQQDRLESQRKFELFDFNSGIHTSSNINEQIITPATSTIDTNDIVSATSLTVSQSNPVETVQDEVKLYEDTVSKLTGEQLQILQSEHEELLNDKNDQLAKIEKINKSIMDIVSVQTDLAAHLQIQSQNINNILDNQDDIEVNIRQGNKQLNKAKKAAGRTAKLTTYLAIFFGILILFLDYIS
ncbi:Ufe1p NDAI_0A03220 [Naumovozyma dairenensis CBS 421]|uniref:t-SNARE coiled-coil homology domain-containing protein n=1 Tax=Naumovozyma dairenensis (strain ATCC 10597 / BCRC 20456 / CBS 421 / NBRC 0211 / NRRL Y-12639) TaxID=1071378 RepID=G0W3U1_NAUDC|nr:hypothetical protein NDAI_0A03220 [Naumovozyma dairenensis CBS 421]CCD22479.1 hypothetical protein NDAI_0A03220 [Naumovozyma dairenensis CBS 421]